MNDKRLNDMRLLGLTIAYYRRIRGLTQMELAEAVHISRTHISNIEAPGSKTSLSLNKLFDIAEALEVPVKNLFDFQTPLFKKRFRLSLLFCIFSRCIYTGLFCFLFYSNL